MLIENGILKAYSGNMKNVVIPDGVRVIAGDVEESDRIRSGDIKTDGVFYMPFTACKKIETVTMGDSVEEVGPKAFEHCANLRSATFSKKLKKIGLSAFLGCKNLTSFSFPASVTTIETWALDTFNTIEEINYEGTLWQFDKIDSSEEAFSNIKTLRCTDCTVNFENKPFYIDEIAYPKTLAELTESYKDSWILRRTRTIHCSDGDFTHTK